MKKVRRFRDQPLARKAIVLGLLPTLAVLLVVTAAYITDAYVEGRRALDSDLRTQAAVIAESANAALGFDQPQVARDLVRALHARPDVDAVCVYDAAGQLFASYERQTGYCGSDRAHGPAAATRRPVATQRVDIGSRVAGTVEVVGNLDAVHALLGTQLVVAATAAAAALLLALLMTGRLQRFVVDPILALASTADAISTTGDYAIRAEKRTEDEVGRLVDSFNGMLGRIERQNDDLKREVDDRTRAEQARAVALEREREASRLKDEFLAAVSHELRTPLNAILGWVQILNARPPTPETLEKALPSLSRNAAAQARVVSDLVDVSRMITGKLSFRRDTVDVRTVVERAVDVVGGAADARAVALDIHVPDESCLISGDADRVQQILWNLLSNAIKFTPSGGQVTLRLTTTDAEHVVTVSDTGSGIPLDFLPHVFERFRQADGSATRQHGGLGLGLAIVKELVELHGGTVDAASEGPGRGATFVARFPRLDAVRRTLEEADTSLPPLNGVRVLAVDDNPDALDILVAALTGAGASVKVATTGDDAVRIWEAEPCDVLVCDLAMPGMDGLEVLEAIRRHDAAHGRSTAAVALTAHASQDDRTRSRRAGFQAHVAKPYTVADLLYAVALVSQRV
ncbi:MAG TPA: ATP-binding protein [Vicinamibacterales bacterium]|nr:ATP-binding protein [Vicinamibacterales bacterium]